MKFSYSWRRSLFATFLDVFSKAIAMTERTAEHSIPKVPMRQFIRASRGPQRHEFLRRAYAANGPIVQMQIVSERLKALTSRLARLPDFLGGRKFKKWSAQLAAYPSRMVFVSGADLLADISKQTESLERVYTTLGFAGTLGANSIFLLEDKEDGAGDWRFAHDIFAPFFRRDAAKSMDRILREEARRAAVLCAGPDGCCSIRQLSDFTSAAVIHQLLFGCTIDPADCAKLDGLAEQVWEGKLAEGQVRSAYRREFEEMVARLRPRLSGQSLLAKLQTQAQELGDEWLMNQLVSLFFAGQETTRMLLAFALFRLVAHPEQQAAFRLATPEAETARSCFLREVLRLHPPVAWIPRMSTRPLQIGKFTIPAGSSVQIDIQSLHTLVLNWGEDAQEFRPERFRAPLAKPMSYCPFGFGKRICIGQHLAMFEAESVLGEWLANYHITAMSDQSPALDYSRSGVPSMRRAFTLLFRAREKLPETEQALHNLLAVTIEPLVTNP